VTPDYEVRVSGRLRDDWENGHGYYPFDRQKLLVLPDAETRPSPEALDWHRQRKFWAKTQEWKLDYGNSS